MKHGLTLLFLLTSSLVGADINVIPRPTQLTASAGAFTLRKPTTVAAPPALANEAQQLSEMLANATDSRPVANPKDNADITLDLDPKQSELGDEGYQLSVTPQGVRIKAAKPAGIFYGIQTLRQLLPVEIDSPQPVTGVAWSLPCVEIRDVPRFGWRGFMLDSCRHFQSVATVKRVIDLMARQKLNRLHWHLSEDEAWRVEVPGHPELTAKGAWRSGREEGKDVARYGGYYSVKDVKEIVDYARRRHVLVYPELEMPGHSTAAIYAYPQFSCDGKPVVPGAPGELGIGSIAANGRRAFCPSRPETYQFLEDVALKVSDLFETPYIHIGADEVPREQWDKCARCRAFIAKEKLKDNIGLQQYFGRRIAGFLRSHGKQPIYWGVDLERGIPDGITVQGWHPGESALAAKKGFATINSDCRGAYFDFPAGAGDTGDGSKWLGKLPIETVYQFDPEPAGLTADQARLVMGSEAALWTEYVPEHKLMSKIFPRLFAFAEIVWSPRQARDFKEFQQRMVPQLQRLERMDVPYFGQQADGRTVGAWSPDKLKPGDTTLDFDADAVIRPRPGRYQATFRFQRGKHALEIRSVALLRDGVEISRDQHAGLAGGRHENNTFILAIPDAKTGRFTFRATVAGLGGTDSTGEVLIAPAPAAAEASTAVAPAGAAKAAPFVVDPSYLSRHDIVYQAPMQLESEGFPLGNGNMGGLIWTHDDGVELQIHKNDVWSDAGDDQSTPGGMAVPRHCARVRIDFGLPVFSWIHTLNDYEGRLSLAKGEASFKAKTGAATTSVRSWLAQDRNVWVIECDNAFNNKLVADGKSLASVALERIGSRAFGGWYAGGYPRNPESGAGNTRSGTQDRDILIEETGGGMNFVVACRILGANKPAIRVNNHRVVASTENPKFTVLVSVATKDETSDPRKEAVALLDRAERESVAKLKAAKDAWYAGFWARSFVKLGDDYLENIYYLRRYLMGAGSRGKYPVTFNGGLWRWNRDVTNWVTPHHWNTQQQYWGLCAQNDCDLMRPYINTYCRMAQQPGMAQLAAQRGAKDNAILLAEMHRFDGTMVDPNRGDMKNNLTPASQVASRMWEYYEYSGDKGFLETQGYDFMKRAANFYLQKLVWKPDKNCFSLTGSVYEDGGGNGAVENPQSDRNCIEALFKSCIRAATVLGKDAAMIPKWQHVLDHLWERHLVQYPDFVGPVIAPCDTPGKYQPAAWAVGGAVAFPADLIGIDQKDEALGKAVANYIRGVKTMYSHHPTPVIAARMGMGDDALRLLKDGIAEMQYFPQGLMFNCRGYPSDIYNLNLKANLLGPARAECTIKWRDFFQCGMEAMSLCGTAMNEMMMQSNEGKIRVFPALPAEWTDAPLAFKLLARGGFLVTAERQKGEVVHVGLTSQLGGTCRVQNPWPGQAARVYEQGSPQPINAKTLTGDIIAFETRPAREYRLSCGDAPPATAPATVFRSEPNQVPKKLGTSRTLGIAKGVGN